MNFAVLTILFLAAIGLGYRFYGRFVASKYDPDDTAPTPAVLHNDGVDYTPTKPFYLMGQHFSAIAAAGPIAGPIIACQLFGWLPCLAWIVVGAIFIGAVHDYSSLMVSVRHRARSIAEIVRQRLGKRAWFAMMLFIWIALLYVILAFVDITANTFVGNTQELEEGKFWFNPGGAVAAASIMYLSLAVIMGVVQKKLNPPLWLQTIIFVPASIAVVWLGTEISTVFILNAKAWALLILAYCFVASLLPMWLLLQPRGYLGGFILYIVLALGLVGLLFGGYTIQQPAFVTWHAPGLTGALFPFLFVTIACGACSGFHGLVASGTTSKQISLESHCRPVGYGGMLLEGFVALVALATVMMVVPDSIKGVAPGTIYGDGIGRFLTLFLGQENFIFAATFGAMAFSTFVFDTLDVATRLGRYILQELFGFEGRRGAVVATALTVFIPAIVEIHSESAWTLFWTLFGTSNQLLAALSLLAITIYLKATGRPYWFTLIPMLFVMAMTVWSLFIQTGWAISTITAEGFAINVKLMNGFISMLLLFLAGLLTYEAVMKTRPAAFKPESA